MSIFSRFLPKRKPPEIKNNIPKEKANIRKTFGIYCHKHHDTSGDKLCPKCTALLATVMTKMNRCPYGITKPICDRCDRPCFPAPACSCAIPSWPSSTSWPAWVWTMPNISSRKRWTTAPRLKPRTRKKRNKLAIGSQARLPESFPRTFRQPCPFFPNLSL